MKYVKDDKIKFMKLKKAVARMALGPHVVVGVLEDEQVTDEFSMVDLAIVHEFGSNNGRIKSRSFMRSTCDKKQKEHASIMAKLQSKYILGQLNIKKALSQLGEIVSKNMVQTINDGLEPVLAESTLKNRKKNKDCTPLIDTGRLKGSLTYNVRGC
jgi:phage gpG-like protein